MVNKLMQFLIKKYQEQRKLITKKQIKADDKKYINNRIVKKKERVTELNKTAIKVDCVKTIKGNKTFN